ncbi:MAG: hypothetical protein QOF61_1482, partial [Acidobacteriota bacterium]|nr:hypothetical protein [Acidobacteriota bacterium]
LLKLLLLCAVMLFGCDAGEGRVRRAFLKKHPDYQVVHVEPDGNDKGAYYYVRYTKPNDSRRYEIIYWEKNDEFVEGEEFIDSNNNSSVDVNR